MRRAPLDACITSRALAVLGRIRRAVPRAFASRSLFAFSTTYRLTASSATEHLR